MSVRRRFVFYAASVVAMFILVVTIFKTPVAAQVKAALVQVVNTPANPVPVVDPSKSAQQIVELECTSSRAFPPNPCIAVTSGAANGGTFTVPPGQSFVITGADMLPPAGTGNSEFDLLQGPPGSFSIREAWSVARGGPMVQFQFPSGIVITAGSQVSLLAISSDTMFVDIHGYLTSN